jgi:hypothetical protein
MFVDIQVDIKFTPPLARDISLSVQAGDTLYFSLDGADSRGSPTPLGYFFSVGGFRQVFQNNTYQLGTVTLQVRGTSTHHHRRRQRSIRFSKPALRPHSAHNKNMTAR